MTSADEFDCAVLRGASHDEGGVLSGESALGEDAVGGLDHAFERQVDVGEATEGGVEVAHEHGRGYTLAGNVAQQKYQAAVGLEQIAVVSADQARRGVVVAGVEARGGEMRLGQERLLNARGWGQVSLEG